VKPDTEHGFAFEEDFAERNGLEQVPGSGNQWHNTQDVHGFKARWQLKSTRFKAFPLEQDDLLALEYACLGPGGTGEIPLAAVNFEQSHRSYVVMREEDFHRITQEKLVLTRQTKVEAKLERARVPEILREEE
jgi:hypothetical protein